MEIGTIAYIQCFAGIDLHCQIKLSNLAFFTRISFIFSFAISRLDSGILRMSICNISPEDETPGGPCTHLACILAMPTKSGNDKPFISQTQEVISKN